MYSTVLVIPAALLAKANALGEALGHGPESYTVAISTDGAPPTHWGAHAMATEEFFQLIMAAKSGNLPSIDWSQHGLTQGDVVAVLGALIISAPSSPLDPDGTAYASPSEHFTAVIGTL